MRGFIYDGKTYLGQGWSSVLGSVGSWDTSAIICVSSLEKDRKKMLDDLQTHSHKKTLILHENKVGVGNI